MGWTLDREVMAGLALAVFWIHVLLIAGAAGLELRDLLGLRRRWRPLARASAGASGLVRATVRRGHGPGGALARNVVEQVGRGKGDGKILFSDAAHRSEVFGGELELDDGTRVAIAAAVDGVVVWPELGARRAAAALGAGPTIAEVEAEARRARGWRREVVVALGVGDVVWIAGAFSAGSPADGADGETLQLEAGERAPLLIAAIEPRRWLARKAGLVVGFILAELAVAAACTLAAVWPPMFDWISMLGAGAALGFFLAVQPLGVSLAEGVRTPDRAYLRGRWEGT